MKPIIVIFVRIFLVFAMGGNWPAYAASDAKKYHDALRDGVVYVQTQKWTVAADYWSITAKELSKAGDFNKVDLAFMAIMQTIALEKSGDAKAYSAWTKALGIYLENGTNWERERQALAASIEKVKYDVGSSFSSDGVGLSSSTKNALILESLDNILNFTAYEGPQPGLEVVGENNTPNVSVSRSYFPRPTAYLGAPNDVSEKRSRIRGEVNLLLDDVRGNTIPRGIQAAETESNEEVQPDNIENDAEYLSVPDFDPMPSNFIVKAYPSIAITQTGLEPITVFSSTVNESEKRNTEIIVDKQILQNRELISRRIFSDENGKITDLELEYAKRAWRYFENNYQANTGLYNSVHKYPFATMWDIGSALAALYCAFEIGVIDELYYDEKMSNILNTLRDIPLYKGKLPNREYDTRSGLMTNLKNIVDDNGSGYSSLDIGRTLTWLSIVSKHHERFADTIAEVVGRWDLESVLDGGEFYRELLIKGKTDRKQEGRIGYEQYAAMAFLQWQIEARNALDADETVIEIVSGVEILRDRRTPDFLNLEPFLISMLEFSSIPDVIPQQASALINAHIMQSQKIDSNLLYAEDSIDEAPWFLYNIISSPEGDWLCKTSRNKVAKKCQTVSTKAAFMADALFDLGYLKNILTDIESNFDIRNGYFAGFYGDGTLNKALTSNTNALILESLAFKKRGAAFIDSEFVEKVAASKSRLAN